MRSNTLGLILRLTVSGIAIVTALVAFEVILRMGIIRSPVYDRLEWEGQKNPTGYRVLLVGDSYVAKWAFDFYPGLVKQLAARGATIMNLSFPGAGPNEYYSEFKAYAPGFKPDLVILFYYTGNDITEVQHVEDESQSLKGRFKYVVRPYLRRSYLYHFYIWKRYSFFPRQFDFTKAVDAGISPEMVKLVNDQKVNPYIVNWGLTAPRVVLDNLLMDQPQNRKAFLLVGERFRHIFKDTQDMGAVMQVVIFPDSPQVNKSHFPFLRQVNLQLDERTLTTAHPQNAVKSLCRLYHVPVLDLLPLFRQHKHEELYLTNDTHMNPRGNALAIDPVVKFVLDHNPKLRNPKPLH